MALLCHYLVEEHDDNLGCLLKKFLTPQNPVALDSVCSLTKTCCMLACKVCRGIFFGLQKMDVLPSGMIPSVYCAEVV
jgi:hypothetical protein